MTRPERARSAWGAPLQGARDAEPELSARVLIDGEFRVSVRLHSDVCDRPAEIAHPQGAQVISVRPAEPRTQHNAIPIGDSCPRALQTLPQSPEVDASGQLQHHVNVVPHDA